jgi:hypothetical protein
MRLGLVAIGLPPFHRGRPLEIRVFAGAAGVAGDGAKIEGTTTTEAAGESLGRSLKDSTAEAKKADESLSERPKD